MQTTRVPLDRKPEHLIEIAVEKKTPPVHAEQVAAHDDVQVFDAIGTFQEGHVVGELAVDCSRLPNRFTGMFVIVKSRVKTMP